jgi:hypothetical protein
MAARGMRPYWLRRFVVGSCAGYHISNRDGKDRVPSPDLGFLQDEIKKDLKISRIVETKSLGVQ